MPRTNLREVTPVGRANPAQANAVGNRHYRSPNKADVRVLDEERAATFKIDRAQILYSKLSIRDGLQEPMDRNFAPSSEREGTRLRRPWHDNAASRLGSIAEEQECRSECSL